MQRLGQLILKNSWDYKVYGALSCEKSSTKMSVDIYIVSPDGEMSQLYSIKKSALTKKNTFDFILDLDGDFARDDVDKIKNSVVELFKKVRDPEKIVATQTKATVLELYQAVSDFIRENEEDLGDNPDAEYFIKDGYGYMLTTKMNEFLAENKELGYKKLEVLKTLKYMGALHPSASRPYDTAVRIGGKVRWFFKIELAPVNTEDVQGAETLEMGEQHGDKSV